MIVSLTVILLCQLLGEAVVRGLGWPVPGPVLGMVFMLAILILKDRIRRVPAEFGQSLDTTGRGLLTHLSLLFVPAGVGIIQRLDVLAEYGIGLAVALVVSTLATLLVTVGTFVLVSRLGGSPATSLTEDSSHE
jgi:holin-like protein